MLRNSAFGVVGLLAVVALAAAQLPNPVSSKSPQQANINVQQIVLRMEQAAKANRVSYRPYVVTREYRLYSGDDKTPNSTVKAKVTFIPPKTEDFAITGAQGSSRGKSIVRHVLEHQQKAAMEETAPGAVTGANYNFVYLGDQKLGTHNCYVLKIEPKADSTTLIDGRAWVDKQTYLVLQLDGDLAKTPSWWLKSVHVTLTFNDVRGMWLQTHTRAVAEVRIFGRHIFQADDLAYGTPSIVADVEGQRSSRSGRDEPRELGTAVVR